MLNFFRSRANSTFIKVLMSFLVFTFALWGVGDMLRNTNVDLALQVGDQHIDQFEWQNLYQEQLAVLSQQVGKIPSKEEIKQLGIDKLILNSTIDRLLYLEEAHHMNLLVSDEMAKMEIASMPHFQKDGKFNKDIFANILRKSGRTEENFLQTIKQEITIRTLITSVILNKTLPDSYIDNFLKALAHKRSGKIYELSPENLVVSKQPTDGDIEKLYTTTKSNYSIPEQRTVEYITFGINDIKQTESVSDDDLKALYTSRAAMYNIPESRNVSQLLFKDEDKAKEAYALLQSGTPFNDVGKKFFPNQTSFILSDNILENSLEEGMNNVVFTTPVGKVSPPYQSDFGWHIFMVNAIKPNYTKTFDEVKTDLKKSYLDEKKFEQLSELAQGIDKEISMGDDLDKVAEKHQFKLKTISGYNQNQLTTTDPISNNTTFMTTAFATDLGSTSSVTPYKGQEEFFALRVKNIIPQSFQPKDELLPILKAEWINQERQKLFTDQANLFQQSIKNGAYNKEIAKQLSLKQIPFEISYVKPDNSVNSDVFAEIYKLKVGQTTIPLQVSGKYQIAVLEKAESVDISNLKDERQRVKTQLMQDIPEELLSQYLDSLRLKYKIVINTNLLDLHG